MSHYQQLIEMEISKQYITDEILKLEPIIPDNICKIFNYQNLEDTQIEYLCYLQWCEYYLFTLKRKPDIRLCHDMAINNFNPDGWLELISLAKKEQENQDFQLISTLFSSDPKKYTPKKKILFEKYMLQQDRWMAQTISKSFQSEKLKLLSLKEKKNQINNIEFRNKYLQLLYPDNPGAPDCWYHCITYILCEEFTGIQFRETLADWLIDNPEFLEKRKKSLFSSDGTNITQITCQQFIENVKTNAWADNVEILATAKWLTDTIPQKPILIIWDNRTKHFNRDGEENPLPLAQVEQMIDKPQFHFINYSGNHYRNMIRKTSNHIFPGEVIQKLSPDEFFTGEVIKKLSPDEFFTGEDTDASKKSTVSDELIASKEFEESMTSVINDL